jgi:hypothetical protein
VRLADVTVPIATYTGWALRSGPQANDGCESSGQFIPFAKTQAERVATGDPRRSVAERYPTFDVYAGAIRRALDRLVQARLMLCEDVAAEQTRLYALGLARGVPAPAGGVQAAPETVPHCKGHRGESNDGEDD